MMQRALPDQEDDMRRRNGLRASAALLAGMVLGSGLVPVAIDDASAVTCYQTRRDASYNYKCFDIRHWVKRGPAKTIVRGPRVGLYGTSAVPSYVDWRSSGTTTY
ncbi:hypothetical protein SAMN06309945_2154 [Okibacterium fritillariae]|uniref:Uncharacterized protein n=2 Tax=Okibacterium fritillariae TaxID=123320 RepID=A0A1T5KED0_9MICO|nr:hypothetical protein SAMN06309945_2154 [Okibacterium fritillariae]